MRIAALTAPRRIQLFAEPSRPIPGPGQALVRVKAVGICGTDLHVFSGHRTDVTLPRVMGHELSGIVEQVGSGVAHLKTGDPVVFDPVVACGSCKICRNGHENVCGDVKCFGVQMDGGFQEYIAVDEGKLYKIAGRLTFAEAALAEPFSVAANILGAAGAAAGESMVILGAGTIGLATLQVAKLLGLRVMITDIEDRKLAAARTFGADSAVNTARAELAAEAEAFSSGGADILVDAVGTAALTEQLIGLAAPRARLVVIGFDNRPVSIPPVAITKKELTLVGSRMNNRQFPQVVEWMAAGRLNLSGMISRTYPLEQIQQAFEDTIANSDSVIKTIIEF